MSISFTVFAWVSIKCFLAITSSHIKILNNLSASSASSTVI